MQYRSCLSVRCTTPLAGFHTDSQQKALKERGIDRMIDEAREDNRENDVEHMKQSCKSSLLSLWAVSLMNVCSLKGSRPLQLSRKISSSIPQHHLAFPGYTHLNHI